MIFISLELVNFVHKCLVFIFIYKRTKIVCIFSDLKKKIENYWEAFKRTKRLYKHRVSMSL